MRFFIFISFLGAALLCGCEEPVELGIDTKDLVIESRIQAGVSPTVTIRVVDGFGQFVKSDILQQSLVTLHPEGLEGISFNRGAFSDSSSTFTSDYTIGGGGRYTLLIQTPGFADLRSITEVPVNVPIRSAVRGETGPNGGILPTGDVFHLPLEFDDPTEVDNYFHIIVTVRNADSDVESTIPTILDFGIVPRPSDARRYNDTGWMFSDAGFSNGVFRCDVLISKEAVSPYPKPVVTIDLRSVSVDYFNYHLQNSRPKSGNLPSHGQFGTIDNVAGGAGLFGGYSSNEMNYFLEF